MAKSSNGRNSFLFIVLTVFSILLWCYLYRLFLNGSAPLQADAYPYLGHIRFYVESIMHGVYPMWHPFESYGSVNEFFLRRIGEFNPFFWAIIFLNKIGLPFIIAYRLFLCLYFFLGVFGFYLLSQKLFSDHLASFSAALLLLFSCIGASLFESYIILEITPFIWFFYFFISFIKAPQRVFFLGAIFSLMIINITYIPFYFYIIFFIFLASFLGVYVKQFASGGRPIKDFIVRNNIFSQIAICLLLVSYIPGLLWYQQTNHNEVSTMQRHSGSGEQNTTTVSVDMINQGGIIPNYIFNRQFVNMDRIGLHDFYIPLFAYLMLFAGAWVRLNRRLLVFFFFGFTVFFIGLADASYIDNFLYSHTPFFKYFRNVQFFLQFAILPAFILFTVEQMRIFIDDCKSGSVDRKWMTLWVSLVHLCAMWLFWHNRVGGVTYAVIIFNLGWMLGCMWSVGSSRVWIFLLWGAIVLQPFEVYSHIAANYPPSYQLGYESAFDRTLPSVQYVDKITSLKKRPKRDPSQNALPYFTTRWLYEAMGSVDNAILRNYLSVPFIVYDRLEQVTDNTVPDRLQTSLNHFENLAYVYSDTMPGVSGQEGYVNPKARIITSQDQDFKFLKFDANDVIVKTAFARPSFLVRTQNYHSEWKAFIDGKPAELLRTNICAQGLWVPAGEHVIHWHFGQPAKYVWDLFLVILYPIVLIGLICLWYQYKVSTRKLSI